MNTRFNLYSRSEEEKSRDMVMYETKAQAQELCSLFEKKKKTVNIVTAAAAVLFLAVGYPLFFNAYDKENVLGMLIWAGAVIVLTFLARLAAGGILCRSPMRYFKWSSLCASWRLARGEMHELEAKFAEQTVFEPDLKKAEKKLMAASERLISFAKENSIS
ncbi:MAG: hypothetical protein IKL24_04120 [Clostridia bacterium]|nr:hypothetical protein [Clostridia bacterium]